MVDSPDGVIDRYAMGATPRDIQELIDAIRSYAAQKSDDTLDDGLVDELGCMYDPARDGWSPREWLAHVCTRLEQHLQRKEEP